MRVLDDGEGIKLVLRSGGAAVVTRLSLKTQGLGAIEVHGGVLAGSLEKTK